MALNSSSDQYGTVAVTIHWLTAVLILIALLTGFRAAAAEDVATEAALLRVHLPAAILVLVLTVVRVVWWLGIDDKPEPIAGAPSAQQVIARIVHLLFYVVVFGMVASGTGMMLASGALPAIFSHDATSLPEYWRYRPRIPHGFGARLLIVLLIAHVAAALYHHLRGDRVFGRMWFGRSPTSQDAADRAV
ncbi:cytochrome b561 [Rhodopseudomonas thermotolerans]|uniref:Cytochrome b561 n=2 Tax=Rhodopseudomonas TaxID=1073 RepID=A0A336JL09_9BRAD|nr:MULTISPECIES: cytochrome b/b6 domain-containing protein [Rhodopseudomonas]RED37865.1 cytochrome b561 [Rhodopseudomonas pentothenatexigens]REG04599.1 cytochrome b561 [Rhodopseudomonas thermotolerans]SSW90365.1 cytochrome b561 [Rhodopseudomonas pentothenatexigens]